MVGSPAGAPRVPQSRSVLAYSRPAGSGSLSVCNAKGSPLPGALSRGGGLVSPPRVVDGSGGVVRIHPESKEEKGSGRARKSTARLTDLPGPGGREHLLGGSLGGRCKGVCGARGCSKCKGALEGITGGQGRPDQRPRGEIWGCGGARGAGRKRGGAVGCPTALPDPIPPPEPPRLAERAPSPPNPDPAPAESLPQPGESWGAGAGARPCSSLPPPPRPVPSRRLARPPGRHSAPAVACSRAAPHQPQAHPESPTWPARRRRPRCSPGAASLRSPARRKCHRRPPAPLRSVPTSARNHRARAGGLERTRAGRGRSGPRRGKPRREPTASPSDGRAAFLPPPRAGQEGTPKSCLGFLLSCLPSRAAPHRPSRPRPRRAWASS